MDEKGTNNYLRIDYPEGTRYVCVSENTKGDFNDDLEPVRDAKSFVPFDVEAGRYRQYWLTLRVPADAKPGAYCGRIAFVSDGRDVGGLDLALEVYPFTLPTPRTRRDPAKEFFVWMMNHDTLDCHYRQGKDLSAAVRKVYGIYRNMAEHNCHPGGAGEITALNRLQFPFWDVLHRRGYRVFATAVDSAGAGQNDAKVASRAFTELYAYFDPKDDGQKYERGRAERAMNLWTGKLRKDQKFDGTVEEETISLDED